MLGRATTGRDLCKNAGFYDKNTGYMTKYQFYDKNAGFYDKKYRFYHKNAVFYVKKYRFYDKNTSFMTKNPLIIGIQGSPTLFCQ